MSILKNNEHKKYISGVIDLANKLHWKIKRQSLLRYINDVIYSHGITDILIIWNDKLEKYDAKFIKKIKHERIR